MTEKIISLKDMKFPKGCPKVEFYREPRYCEIVLYLFTKCNLRCEFCFQDHNVKNYIDEEYFNTLADRAFHLMEDEMKAHPTIKSFDIRMLGGEIFSDDIPDSVLERYGVIVTDIRNKMSKNYPDVNVDFIVTTNGVFKKRDRIINFLNKYSFKKIISVSIDFVGRYPTDEVKQTAYDTMKYLADNGFFARAGVVLTKRNINYIMNHKKEFQELVTKYGADQIIFNYYSPNEQWELDLPSDEDLWNIYKFCFEERIYQASTCFYLLEAYKQQQFFTKTCECKFIPTIAPKMLCNSTKDCVQTTSPMMRERFYGKYTSEITEENVSDVKASLGIVKRGCLGCEHYEYCPQPCWCMIIFDGYKVTNCPMKQSFKYIKEHPELQQDYEHWTKRSVNYN